MPPDVKLVVIDGLVDLMRDFMDAGEGHLTVTDIIRLCSEHRIHIAGVLHQNKADANARAHVGSIASQKCEIEVSTEVDKNDRTRSDVKCVNSRGMPFEDFAIRWDKGSLPKICQDWEVNGPLASVGGDKSFEKNKELAEVVFKPLTSISHTDAITALMQVTQKSESTAKRLLNDLQQWGHVTKGEDGFYRLKAR